MSHHVATGGGMFNATAAPGPAAGTMAGHHKRLFMHMTFYWGNTGIILFPFWPGWNTFMYGVAVVFVFFLAVVTEWLSHTRLVKPDQAAGLGQTVVYTAKSSASYLLMLAVMSFNGGIFIAAMLGMGLGFFFFGSKAFEKNVKVAEEVELPPLDGRRASCEC